jgi:hypothetical protein
LSNEADSDFCHQPPTYAVNIVYFNHTLISYIDYLQFYVPLKNISLVYGDITIAGEELQNLGLCSAIRAFEQGGIFIVPHLL